MPVTVEEYQKAIQLFLQRIAAKTSWGKNELKALWNECFMAAAMGAEVEE